AVSAREDQTKRQVRCRQLQCTEGVVVSRTLSALVRGNRRSSVVRAAAFTLENLEVRRLLSTTYNLSATLLSPDAADSDWFGTSMVTQGNLALVASPHKTIGGFELAGQVNLIDTSTNTVLHTFDNPDAADQGQFGTGMAFVGDKIAISAPQPSGGTPK